MIPADLGTELRRATAAAISAGELPPEAAGLNASGTWRPGRSGDGRGRDPASYATSLPFGLARLVGGEPLTVAARLAARLGGIEWIGSAEPTGGGYLTITVTQAALAAVAVRISRAGDNCLRTDGLAGVSMAMPPLPDLAEAPGWAQAWREQAAALTGRLAATAGATAAEATTAAGATAAESAPAEPAPAEPAPAEPAPAEPAPAEATALAAATAESTAAEPATAEPTAAGTTEDGVSESSATPPTDTRTWPARPASTALGDMVSYAGADAVRYWLARRADAPAEHAGAAVPVMNGLSNPAYAVSFAHADAASTLRWAADLGLARAEPDGQFPALLGEPAERALLGQLSWAGERVAGAARRGRPAELPRYLEQVAGAWLACREECPALPFGGRAAPRTTAGISARLWLAAATATVLAAGLRLAGIVPPDRA